MEQPNKCECGCIKIKVIRDVVFKDWFAFCNRCGKTTNGYSTKSEAINAWNQKEGVK